MSFSEFVGLVSERSGEPRVRLVEWDVVLHSLLSGLVGDRRFAGRYLLKGGTCLAKCYLGYHRFSVDLDFTYARREDWGGLGRRERRRAWVGEAERVANLLSEVARGRSRSRGTGRA